MHDGARVESVFRAKQSRDFFCIPFFDGPLDDDMEKVGTFADFDDGGARREITDVHGRAQPIHLVPGQAVERGILRVKALHGNRRNRLRERREKSRLQKPWINPPLMESIKGGIDSKALEQPSFALV